MDTPSITGTILSRCMNGKLTILLLFQYTNKLWWWAKLKNPLFFCSKLASLQYKNRGC